MVGSDSEIRFDGRAILVTGAGRGLGLAHARLLAERGAKVVIADNGSASDGAGADAGPAASAAAQIKAAGAEAVACVADISTEDGCEQAVASCVQAFGRIDGVLHNASTMPDNAPVERMSSHDLDMVMRTNPYAGLWLSRAAWPHMLRERYGRIVLMTSAGIYGSQGNAPYAAAKAAVIGAVRCLALEGAPHGILVNAVAPAALTRMTERLPSSPYADWFRATMAAERVSPGVAYLLSEAAQVSGEAFHVGGGRIARLTLSEGEGVLLGAETIEAVVAALPAALAQTDFFQPRDLIERALKVAGQLGFQGELGGSTFTVTAPDTTKDPSAQS